MELVPCHHEPTSLGLAGDLHLRHVAHLRGVLTLVEFNHLVVQVKESKRAACSRRAPRRPACRKGRHLLAQKCRRCGIRDIELRNRNLWLGFGQFPALGFRNQLAGSLGNFLRFIATGLEKSLAAYRVHPFEPGTITTHQLISPHVILVSSFSTSHVGIIF